MHIAVPGNIDPEKPNTDKPSCQKLQMGPQYEDLDTNPYLHSFYEDMQRWSFNLQIYFLNSRFRRIIEIRKSGKTVIRYRTGTRFNGRMPSFFAPNLHGMNPMSTRDFENYKIGLLS